MQTIFKQFL